MQFFPPTGTIFGGRLGLSLSGLLLAGLDEKTTTYLLKTMAVLKEHGESI
jgi:hypothetical protein